MEFRKDLFQNERDDNLNVVGKGVQRQDMPGHVTGRSPFFDDHAFEGLLHLKVVRSPHHHARIRRIDISAAERAPGVKRILRGADVPVNKNTLLSLINFGKDDEPSLAVDKVRYKGEPIVAIIAESEAQALAARALVRVEYDPLPTVFDVEEALKPGAPVVNETYRATLSNITRNTITRSCASAMSSAALRWPSSSSRIATRCLRSSMRRRRRMAPSQRPSRMIATSCIPARKGCSSRWARPRRS